VHLDPCTHDLLSPIPRPPPLLHSLSHTFRANRIYRLRKELTPKISIMDREKPRRAILLLLFLLVGAVLAALVFALWHLFSPAPPVPPPPSPLPVPTATASAPPSPTFDNALPTAPDLLPDGGDKKNR
jgi:hypothetical protein